MWSIFNILKWWKIKPQSQVVPIIPKIKETMPVIDKVFFYKTAREQNMFNALTQKQVDSIDVILSEFELLKIDDLRYLAYMLSTTKHETAHTYLPIEEYGKGKTRPYGKKIKHSGKAYTSPNKIYYGRGFVQLTWYENYELMGRLLKVDLLNHPELALDTKIAAKIMMEGMTKGSSSIGDFTGKCLEQYIHGTVCDYRNARRIINGTDKAKQIADYAIAFEKCLRWI